MDTLTTLRRLIQDAAPAVATALGGPLGGAAVQILAEVFGTAAEPGHVLSAARNADPEVIKANLARAEAAFRAAAEEAVTVRANIDAHVRLVEMDYKRGGFYSAWRPLAGWVAILYGAACCALVVKDAVNAQYAFLGQAPAILAIGAPIMALAGIYAWSKSEERKTAMRSGLGGVSNLVEDLIGGYKR